MALYYVDAAAANDSGSGAIGSPKKYITSAIALMTSSGGDTVIVKDGTYGNASDGIETSTTFPTGVAGAFNTIKAENPGGVRITANLNTPLALFWVKFQDLVWATSTQKNINGNFLYFKNCGFKGGPSSGNALNLAVGTNDVDTVSDILLEDCWSWGAGGRYNILVFNAQRVILRRPVVRHDGGWSDPSNPGGLPESGITFYNCQDCIAQNPIVIDSNLDYDYWYGPLYNLENAGITIPNKNNRYEGVIALNNDGVGIYHDHDTPNTVFENVVLWDNLNGGISGGNGAISFATIGMSNVSSSGDFMGGVGYWGAYTGPSFINGIITGFTSGTDIQGESSFTYSDTYNNSASSSGTGVITRNPRTSANGLLYLTRIEGSGFLNTAGSSGARIGANVLFKIGEDGTFHGNTGYRTVTSNTLWPWPNEDLIKLNFGEDGTANSRRGFANTTAKQKDGTSNVTLTSYIWEYLGNPIPSDIYGASPTITGGNSAPLQNSTATITGTDFGASQGSGSLVIGGVTQTVTSWSDTSISYTVNRGINLNGVAVNAVVTDTNSNVSNSYPLTGFASPVGWYYTTLAEPNANLQLRLTSTANNDLSYGDQLEWNDANVTIYDDATFSAANTVGSFLVRVGVTGYGWTTPATETINSRILTASTGTIVITGIAASLKHNSILTAVAGTITITKNPASLFIGRMVSAASGTIIISGTSANFARTATSASGSIVITGVAANFAIGMPAGTGSIVITGNAAGLIIGGSNSYTLSAAAGVINVSLKTVTCSWGPIRIGANTVYVPGFGLYDGRNIWTTPSITTANNQVASYYAIVVTGDDNDPNGRPVSVTDSYNNTYWPVGDKFIVAPDPVNFITDRIYLFKSENGNGGPNHNATITFACANGAAPFEAMMYFGEILGGSNNPFDLFLSGRDNASPFTANVGPTNANNELIVSFIDQSIGGTTGPQTENTGYNLVNSNPDATNGPLNSLNSKYVSSIGTYGPSYTVTGDEVPTADKGLMLFTLKQYQTVGFNTNLTASSGSYVISGAANLLRTRIFTATKGTILVTGVSASLKRGLLLSASTGVIVITGNNAILTKSGSYTLAAAAGTINVTGVAVTFNRTYNPWLVDAGAINITGTAITPYRTWLRLGAISTGLFSNVGNVPRPYITGPIDTSAPSIYGGNTYIVIVSVGVGAESFVSISDSANNHYDQILRFKTPETYWGSATTGNDYVFIANNAIGNSTLTITVDHDASLNGSSNVQGTIVHFMEFKNTLLLGALDSVGNTRITSSTFHRHIFPTTTSNNELLVATEFLNGQALSTRPYRSNTGFSPVYQFFRDYEAGLSGGPDLFTYTQREFTTGNYTSNTTPFGQTDGKTGMVFGVAIKEYTPTFYTITASNGAITVNGVAAGLLAARIITASSGTVVVTTNPATLFNNHILVSNAGSLIVTGIAANFGVAMPAGTGTVSITGNSANVLVDHILRADTGTIVISGNNANTLFNKVLVAAAGTITITRNAAGTFKGRTTIANNGTIVVGGVSANFLIGYRLIANTGTITVNGIAANTIVGKVLVSAAGSIIITRNAAGMFRGRTVIANNGTIVITGVSAGSIFNHRLTATAGTIIITGVNATLAKGPIMTASAGTVIVTGNAATLSRTKSVLATNGTVNVSGIAANLLFGHKLTASTGAIVISGVNIFVGRRITITSVKGTFTITGVAATMIYNIYRTYTSNGTIYLSGAATLSRGKSANGSGTILVSGTAPISKDFYPVTTTHPLITIGKDSLQNYFFKKFLVNINTSIRNYGHGLNEIIHRPPSTKHVRNHIFTNGGRATVIMNRFKNTKIK